VWHWRVFCDDSWTPLAYVNAADLRASGMVPAANPRKPNAPEVLPDVRARS
jgi:hypothetical protein